MPVVGALRAGARVVGTAALAAEAVAGARRAERVGDAASVRRARAAVLARSARRTLAAHGIVVRAAGPRPAGPALLVANHVSYLDPLAIAALVPCAPISKAELARWPLLGAVARRCGVLFVERGEGGSGLRVMRQAEQALQEGLSVLNFPEGTTTRGDDVLPFRRGLFDVARRVGVPVVPVALSYAPAGLAWVGDATFVPHYLRFAALQRAEVRLAFGAPLPSRAFPTAAALTDAAHARVRALLEDAPACLRKTP